MSWLSEFAGGGGLGFLPTLLFDGGKGSGSKRDAAPIPTGNPSYNSNLSAPANFWQGNQFQIPGAQGLGTGAIPPTMPPQAPAQGGGMGHMGGLAGLLGGMGGMGGGQQQGSASSTIPGTGQSQPPLAAALGGMGQQQNPGLIRLMQMLQGRPQQY